MPSSESMFPGCKSEFQRTDPEFIERFDNFAFDEVVHHDDLDDRKRFMAILAAQGGCEVQLTSHASASIRIGNDRAFLINVLSQCLTYIGYPRCLNALRCVDEAAKP